MVWRERRASERHVVELPIKYKIVAETKKNQTALHISKIKNICDGGLLFLSSEPFELGIKLELSLPLKHQIFTIRGKVVRVDRDPDTDLYRIGIHFSRITHVFKVKMAEQLHQIDRYQQTLSKEEGRIVPEEEAAHRWVEAHSRDFAEFFKHS